MLSHDRVWAAVDALAARHGMTASGLARKAGLDATSFNKSKRTSPEGRDRWPSTESIAKILRATGATLEDFLRLVEPGGSLRRSMVPLIGMTQAGSGKFFTDEGLPSNAPGWDEIDFPDFGQEKVFALEVTGDSMAPLYRDGDMLILSPTASIRKGDRVVVRTTTRGSFGQGTAAPLGQEPGTGIAQSGARGSDDPQRGSGLGRPHHVGAAIIGSASRSGVSRAAGFPVFEKRLVLAHKVAGQRLCE